MTTRTRRKRPSLTKEFQQRLTEMCLGLARTVATTDEELATLEAQQRSDFGEGALTAGTGRPRRRGHRVGGGHRPSRARYAAGGRRRRGRAVRRIAARRPASLAGRARWADIMRSTIAINASFFNTERVLHEYVVRAYRSEGDT
jgi:hypothetical protein